MKVPICYLQNGFERSEALQSCLKGKQQWNCIGEVQNPFFAQGCNSEVLFGVWNVVIPAYLLWITAISCNQPDCCFFSHCIVLPCVWHRYPWRQTFNVLKTTCWGLWVEHAHLALAPLYCWFTGTRTRGCFISGIKNRGWDQKHMNHVNKKGGSGFSSEAASEEN